MLRARKKGLSTILVLTLVLVAPHTSLFGAKVGSAEAADSPIVWKAVTAFRPEVEPPLRVFFLPFVEEVNRRAKGELRIDYIGGPEVWPPLEQLTPLGNKVFDVLYTTLGYYSGVVPEGQVLLLIPPEVGVEKWKTSGLFDALDQAVQRKAKAKVLDIFQQGVPFHFYLNKRIQEADLRGLVIRAIPFLQPLVSSLGGTSTMLPGGEIYTAMQRGTVDGFVWPAFGPADFKWYEVSKYVVYPGFGDVANPVLINSDRWKSLPARLQKTLHEVVQEFTAKGRRAMAEVIKKEQEELLKRGMEKIELSASDGKKIGDNYYREGWKWLKNLAPPVAAQFEPLVGKAVAASR